MVFKRMNYEEMLAAEPLMDPPNHFSESYAAYLEEHVPHEKAVLLAAKIREREAELKERLSPDLKPPEKMRAEVFIYPFIAVYQVLIEDGWDRFDAHCQTRQFFLNQMSPKQPKYAHMHEKKGFFKGFVEGNLRMFEMDPSLTCEVVKNDGKEFFFNCTRCLYVDLCGSCGVPELVDIFCDGDYTYMGLIRNVKLIRTGTLGRGNDYCDFRLIDLSGDAERD